MPKEPVKSPTVQPGDMISERYRLDRLLDVGGMGEVWAARNILTQKNFAVKFLLPELAERPDALERFIREAETAGSLQHPSIVDVFDVAQGEDGRPYIVMELLAGESLEARVERLGPITSFEAAAFIAQIADARCLTDDPAIVQSLSMAVQAEASQLQPLIEAIARFDEVIAEQLSRHPLHTLFESFPGAGPVYVPRLLAAFGEDRSRWGGSVEFLCHSGIAPVTKKSGKSCLVHRRLACSNFVRQTFQEFAAQSIQSSSWARACYDRMRSRGFRHPAAVRSLAYKWIRIMYRCWMDSTPYDEEIYLASLRAKHSPLLQEPSE